MDHKQSISVLEQALFHALKSGVFGFKDASAIDKALDQIKTLLPEESKTEVLEAEPIQ